MARPRTKDTTGDIFSMRWTPKVKEAVETYRDKLEKEHPGLSVSMTDAARAMIMVASAVVDKPGDSDGE